MGQSFGQRRWQAGIDDLPGRHANVVAHAPDRDLPRLRVPDRVGGTPVALARIDSGRRILFVASTDLSHYLPARTAIEHDRRVEECVRAFDPERLLAIFEQYPEGERGRFVACGGGPAIAVMLAARTRGARHGRILKYMHSGEISGDNTGVVGYLAAAMGTFSDVH